MSSGAQSYANGSRRAGRNWSLGRRVRRAEESPRTVELLSANMSVLETVGADFRARLAHELRREGLTIESVADLFGVTRQRVSALLRQRT